ncbi:MAG: N-acetylmuramoyl-L-alanine amidase, partial [Saprospiraceae bacterium]|nr:N-acetylmuramoyl-L-alanine amidase [Saprospiraceae bacterium]
KGIDKHTVVCIHVDSRSPQRRQDVFFYYYPHSKSGRGLALQLQKVFREKYRENRPGRDYRGTVSSRDLYVLKYTDPTAVYVELANIRNASDRYRILPESNRQALANWLFEGLAR